MKRLKIKAVVFVSKQRHYFKSNINLNANYKDLLTNPTTLRGPTCTWPVSSKIISCLI